MVLLVSGRIKEPIKGSLDTRLVPGPLVYVFWGDWWLMTMTHSPLL